MALDLVESLDKRYFTAGPRHRRKINQALIERIDIGRADQAPTVKLASGYEFLLEPDVLTATKQTTAGPI